MAVRMVKCVKLGRELPGLDEPPFDSELGQRIYENVSEQAWQMWAEHLKMMINEYRLNPATLEAQAPAGETQGLQPLLQQVERRAGIGGDGGAAHQRLGQRHGIGGVHQSRKSSLIEVLARVPASTRLTITAQ